MLCLLQFEPALFHHASAKGRILAIFSSFLIAALSVAGNAMEINTGLPAASIQILMMLVLLTIMATGGRKNRE